MSKEKKPTVLSVGATGSISPPLVRESALQRDHAHVRTAVRKEVQAETFKKESVEKDGFNLHRTNSITPLRFGVLKPQIILRSQPLLRVMVNARTTPIVVAKSAWFASGHADCSPVQSGCPSVARSSRWVE